MLVWLAVVVLNSGHKLKPILSSIFLIKIVSPLRKAPKVYQKYWITKYPDYNLVYLTLLSGSGFALAE